VLPYALWRDRKKGKERLHTVTHTREERCVGESDTRSPHRGRKTNLRVGKEKKTKGGKGRVPRYSRKDKAY